ncbi:MAG: ABC transporter ATP-binding protein, partial [Alphaproteobacteria bacterium]|nr:ABC transporter ATP-binding protein [Alphaproteobacteria bacterium]
KERKAGRKAGRKDSAPQRAALRACERRMAELTAERAKAEASLADPALYETADGAKIERLTRKLAEIDRTMVHQEEIWLRAQQDLDDALETRSRRP